MNIKQIRYFAAVVEHGSLSAAAKSQRITVQAISKSIADLECEIGCDLFARNNQGMHPTPFAVSFHERAVRVLSRFEDLESFARRHEKLGGGLERLRMALNTPAFLGNEVVLENTATFVQARVGVETTNVLASGERGFEGLQAGEFDVLLTVGAFMHHDVECRTLGTVPSAVMMSRSHPLAAKEKLSLEDMAPYPVAISSWFDGANDSIAAQYRVKGGPLTFVDLELEDIGAHFVNGGVLFTTGIPALEKYHTMAAVRPLVPKDSIAVPICAVFLKERSREVTATLSDLLASGLSGLGFGGPGD